MKYSLTLSIILYICGCFYMIFGAITIRNNTKSKVNRLFLLLACSLAIWSFAYSISNSAPTAEVSTFWRTFSVFGWGGFSSILLHFVLVLTKAESRLNRRSILALLYLPALINIILFGPFGYLVEKQYVMVQTDYGWLNVAPMYAAGIWLNSYYFVFSLVTLILLIRWWRKMESHTPEKRYARNFLLSIMLLFFIEFFLEALPDLLEKKFFPKIPVIFLLIPTVMLFLVLRKFGLLTDRQRKTYSLSEIQKNLDADRVRLFPTVTTIFLIGGTVSFFIGYFGMKGKLENELLLAAILFLIGIFVRFVPFITKNHTIQNIIFLVINTLGMLFIMIRNTETGGLTLWSIYILFLLLTVILDDKINAFVFTVICALVQVIFWTAYPEVNVTIDGNEYLTRIFIIILSYFIVRYLTTEYASKVKDYRRFAREQEVLERISSSFISINRENAKKKIDEMLEMADEILEFSHAYVVEFDKDYEDAMILNTCVKDLESGSFPFRPGMKVKSATLPMIKPLIDQDMPMICENITNISADEGGEQRGFFLSRGIQSFIALPIKVDQEIQGIIVVEYKDLIDIDQAEGRLYLLKILVNILADARKKLLYETRLYNFAYFDETTKLANRSMLKIGLDQIILNRKGPEKIAVLDIEIENLRMINDTFGHSVGEQIIIESALILENIFKGSCDIARSSEGNFVVVLPTVENIRQIEECTKRILDSFSRPISAATGIEALFVVVGIGISVYPDNGKDADTLLRNANLAGYEAKNVSEKIGFYTERLENQIAENTLLTNRLFNSLQNEEFFLEYQPQISCVTGKTVGVEALLRWKTDSNERVLPDRFIPILEQTGLIYDIGLWVLSQALQEHNRLITKGLPPLRFAINLSVGQFREERLVPDFTKIIEESGVDPKYIELEITESLFSENPEEISEKLYTLKDLGLSIAIDDFGKGYSSLSRLNLIPFDRIKIDKDMIKYVNLKTKRVPITEVVILLAKAFNASITAEGWKPKNKRIF